MKPKDLIRGALLLTAIIYAVTYFFSSMNTKPTFEGVVMEPRSTMVWKKVKRDWIGTEKVKIFSAQLGTVLVTIPDRCEMNADTYFDYALITYRDMYPPALGKTICVKVKYDNDNNLIVTKAWVE